MNKIDRNKCMKNDVSIELYGEIKYLMNEWVEESKKIINSKERLEKEVQELRKENEDLDIELGRIPHLKEEVREAREESERLEKENERLEMAMIDMNDNWCESILYEIGLGGKNVRERLNSISLLEKKVEDWERMMNLKTERMRDISEEDWVNGRY